VDVDEDMLEKVLKLKMLLF